MKKLLLLLLPFLFLSCSTYDAPHSIILDFLDDEDLPEPKVYYSKNKIITEENYKTELYLYYDFTPCDLSFDTDVIFVTAYRCLEIETLPNKVIKISPNYKSEILNDKDFENINEIVYAITKNNGKAYLNIPIIKY